MAPDRKSDEILLNALADGELSPAEQAAAAARLAGDRDFARAYATLSKLKANVIDSAEARDDADVRLPAIASSPKWRGALIGAGGVLAASLMLGFVFIRLLPADDMRQAAATVSGRAIPAAFTVEPVIPDLSPAGLQLARTVVSAHTNGQALVATYVGPRGCRLELWVSHTGRSAKSAGGTERHSWRVDGLVYELIAYGMPAARFEKVAAAAEEATRATALPEAPDQRLIEARVSSVPCLT
jgi:anti-sigma factor RsiW